MGLKSELLRQAAAMDKLELERALTRLGQLLRERRVVGEVAVFGGAAIALSEFLDEFYPSGPSERQGMIGEQPALTGVAFQDAYVGAVGEHLARRWGLDIPAWADDPRRFLERPHFPDYMELAKPVYPAPEGRVTC